MNCNVCSEEIITNTIPNMSIHGDKISTEICTSCIQKATWERVSFIDIFSILIQHYQNDWFSDNNDKSYMFDCKHALRGDYFTVSILVFHFSDIKEIYINNCFDCFNKIFGNLIHE